MNNEIKIPEFLKTKEVAALLNVKATKVYQFIKYNGLPNIKIGRKYLFVKESILQWKAEYDRKIEEEKANSIPVETIAKMIRSNVQSVKKFADNYDLPCVKREYGRGYRYLFNQNNVIAWLLEQEKNKLKPPVAKAAAARPAGIAA